MKAIKFTGSIMLILLPFILNAQLIEVKNPGTDHLLKSEDIPTYSFPKLNHKQLLEEDKIENENKDVALRIAIPFEVEIDVIKEGLFYFDKQGKKNWMLKLELPGAYGVGLLFSKFNIPDGSELYVFNKSLTSINGAITSANNNKNDFLHVSPVQGSEIYILYKEDSDAEYNGELLVSAVTHLYRNLFNKDKGFGDSGSCNVNVVCEEGNSWTDEIRSVALIINSTGSRICTGALVNNVALDGTPYFLTANHCISASPNFGQWSFIFDYKSEDCSPSVNGLLGNSLFGSELKASSDVSDFALFELDETPPSDFNVYYAGWSRSTLLIQSTTGIHHPSGDVMKISSDDDPPVLSAYLGGAGADYWRVVDWDSGTTEGGSSGSPLFNPSGKIIGQLRGGQASCSNNSSDYYGAFSVSWDEGSVASERLMDWLDPEDDSPNSLNGIDLNDIGIDDEIESNVFSLFPNPANQLIYLNVEREIYIKQIEIIDALGQRVKLISLENYALGKQSIDINNLSPGMYFLILTTRSASYSNRFVLD